MKKVLLDTNFILTCVKQKIDFFEDIKLMGFGIIIPEEVTREVEKVINSKQKLHVRENARFAYDLLMKNDFEEVKLSENSNSKNVDGMIRKYAKKHPSLIIATLDREIKNKTDNRKLMIREKKKLEIIY